jgi:hypothetical protein
MMKERPFGAAIQVEAPNHRKLLCAKSHGGERYGKGKARLCQVCVMESNTREVLIKYRKRRNVIKTGRESLARDKSGGNLFTVQAVAGMKATRT